MSPQANFSSDLSFVSAGMEYLAKSQDLKKTIAELVRLSANACGSEMGSLYLIDKADRYLKPFVLVNLPPEYIAGCSQLALGEQCCGRAALHKIPWIVEDMFTDPLFVDCREAAKTAGIRSGFSVPVLDAKGECLGTLASHFRERFRPDDHALERSKLFARLIAFALARYEAEKQVAGAAAAD
jgi:GAF domain-containing protein